MNNQSKGRVYLVGAGAGDPELITLKAIRVLENADVVLYDFLAHPNLLHYCSEKAILINVGKRKGCHLKTQEDIHALFLKYVPLGLDVVRLKGGDPLVFGRGGEEMCFLESHGISYEVIPGISSVIAGPTYAGIPLSHRELSSSIAVVTGVPKAGMTLDEIVLPEADTVVVVMPMTFLHVLCERFSQQSRFNLDTPAVLLYSMTRSDQDVLEGTLGTLPDLAVSSEWKRPSLLVVGEVVRSRKSLSWRESLPLFGYRVIVFRTISQGKNLTHRLSRLGAEVWTVPIFKIVSRETDHKTISFSFLQSFSMIVFTSSNGVYQFVLALMQSDCDVRHLAGKRIIAVGDRTADALLTVGLKADVIPEKACSEGICDALSTNLDAETILIPTASKTRGILAKDFRGRGASVTELSLYDSQFLPFPDQGIRDGDFVVFTSVSMVTHFFQSDFYDGQKMVSFCIGDVTADAVKDYGVEPVIVSETATENGLENAIMGYVDGLKECE